ncbi:hypothetical protein IT570_06385 [Candidatus Sumerlaeota bacterium]|nr:hypothetical protein [Candidatus Sumerlaeota bacterium]
MADVQTELNVLENKIQAQLDAAHRVRNMNIIVGIVLIVIVTGYFQYMKSQLAQFSEPKELAKVAAGLAQPNISKLSDHIDAQAREKLPELVDNAFTHVVNDRIPQIRQRLETEVKAKLDQVVAKSETAIIGGFEQTLRDHGKELPELVKNLQTPEGKEAFEEDVFKMLEDAIKEEQIAAQVDSYGAVLKDVDSMLKHYSDPASEKTQDEQLVCEMIAIMREMSKRHAANAEHSTVKHLKLGLGGPDTGSAGGTSDDAAAQPAKAATQPK